MEGLYENVASCQWIISERLHEAQQHSVLAQVEERRAASVALRDTAGGSDGVAVGQDERRIQTVEGLKVREELLAVIFER